MPATFTCALCGSRFASLLLARADALNDVGPKLLKHIQTDHKKEFQVVSRETVELTQVASTLSFQNIFIRIDDDDIEAQAEYEALKNRCLKLLGLEEVEEGEEEEGEKENEVSNVSNIIEMPRPN